VAGSQKLEGLKKHLQDKKFSKNIKYSIGG